MHKYTRAGAFSNSQIVYCRHDFKSFKCAIGIICSFLEKEHMHIPRILSLVSFLHTTLAYDCIIACLFNFQVISYNCVNGMYFYMTRIAWMHAYTIRTNSIRSKSAKRNIYTIKLTNHTLTPCLYVFVFI